MKAIILGKNGSLDNLEIKEQSIPELLPQQVLIKVTACGINPVDWKAILHGGFKLPYVVGSDISGTVIKTGAAVTKFNAGDEVIGSLNWDKQGAFAEYVTTETTCILKKPVNISLAEAAAIPMAGLTAWQGLFDILQLQRGQKILIHAAAGGVGIFALQLAKWKGAYVAVTASLKNHSILVSLGADEVIDYQSHDFSKILKNFDAVFDSVAATEKSYQVLKPGGRYVSITEISQPLSAALSESYGIIARKFLFKADAEQLQQIVALIEKGKLKLFIDSTFYFTDIRRALEYQKEGHSRGKNILII